MLFYMNFARKEVFFSILKGNNLYETRRPNVVNFVSLGLQRIFLSSLKRN